jgi:Ca2+-binding RTX toxin-like protein
MFSRLLRNRDRGVKNLTSRRTGFESLEGRRLMSTNAGTMPTAPQPTTVYVAPSTPPTVSLNYDAATRVVTITGSDSNNWSSAAIDNRGTASQLDDRLVVKIDSAGANMTTQQFDMYKPNGTANVVGLKFNGNGGNDIFYNNTSLFSTINGGSGDDQLFGGSAGDTINGDDGADTIYGGGGIDAIYGGNGADYLQGDAASDFIDGGAGADTILDSEGNNTVNGGTDADFIQTGAGLDTINGDDGDDTIGAGAGNNVVHGGNGADLIYGGANNDTLFGDAGFDQIWGSYGNDLIYGGADTDWLYGGADNDTLFGQNGDDFLYGQSGFDLLDGGDDDDYLSGGTQDDYLFGGNGHDTVHGNEGNDTLSGGRMGYDPATGEFWTGDITDNNFDELYGGLGADKFYLADKKLPYVWLDSAEDVDSSDEVLEFGWAGFLGAVKEYWGHKYGQQV